MVGGLLVSTVFTLFLVPMLFTLTFELREQVWEHIWLRRPSGAGGTVPRVATAGAPLPSGPTDDAQARRVEPSQRKRDAAEGE